MARTEIRTLGLVLLCALWHTLEIIVQICVLAHALHLPNTLEILLLLFVFSIAQMVFSQILSTTDSALKFVSVLTLHKIVPRAALATVWQALLTLILVNVLQIVAKITMAIILFVTLISVPPLLQLFTLMIPLTSACLSVQADTLVSLIVVNAF